MIQKRTMIFGSAQPLEFEVMVDGGHLEHPLARLDLKLATWVITDRVSIKKTPWRIADKNSFLVSTARVPESATQGQGADVAHENGGGEGVEPEKAIPAPTMAAHTTDSSDVALVCEAC